MQTLSSQNQANAEVPINENFQTLEWASIYGKRQVATTGLTWGYYGGLWGGITVADGAVTLGNAATNYLVVHRATGVLSTSTSTANWLDVGTYARVYALTTAGSVVTAVADHRAGLYGVHGPAQVAPSVSADRGDTSQTLVVGTDAPTQLWATALTANRVVTLSSVGAANGSRFRVVRSGLGAFTLDVGGLKTIPSATAAWADVEFTGSAWVLTGYGAL